MDEADERRVELLARAREVSNGNAQFNAIQFPLGAAAVYEKLRGATNRSLLLPAAGAAGIYGFVNSGVVDRERHYLREAFELHCTLVKNGPLLYLDAEINGHDPATLLPAASSEKTTTRTIVKTDDVYVAGSGKEGRRKSGATALTANATHTETTQTHVVHAVSSSVQAGPPSLLQVTEKLAQAIREFDEGRISTSAKLKGRGGSSAPSDMRERRVAQAGGKGGATAGNDKTQDVKDLWLRQVESATVVQQRLVSLRTQINSSGPALRDEVRDISQEAQTLLSERVPLPSSPKDTLDKLRDGSTPGLKAQAGDVGATALDPVLHSNLLAGLSKEAAEEATKFASKQGWALLAAYRTAQAWWASHDSRVQTTALVIERLKCRDRLPPVPLRAPPPPPPPPASGAPTPAPAPKPATDNTGAGTAPLPGASS
ncbi:MAG: hypothetical protein CFE41_08580 [Burkholderiales bacterium PBB2]|nr:MAG: hypothetical protein CFE41_08580 [Burkholderiales bacterium PBB2]